MSYSCEFTKKAQENFQISNLRILVVFWQSLGLIKLAAAESNEKLGLINKKESKAIKQACQEFISGKFNQLLNLDVFQAGAGTSYNMACNEIIASRANEILKIPKNPLIHANNHVNMAQSTNDVIPTAARIAILKMLPNLLAVTNKLEKSLKKIAESGNRILKVGRTHLQDAVPITIGQEFTAHIEAIHKSQQLIKILAKELQILGIGGTAVGTGINTDPKFRNLMIKNLRKSVGNKFQSAKSLCETSNNLNCFLNFSAALRSLTVNILNLSNNLKLMNMGPKAGLAEITLPAVQPGSSIMPGKVNPSIPEAVEMICFSILGNDKTIELAASGSQFQLNVYCPIIIFKLLESIQILTNGINTLSEKALDGLVINRAKIKETLVKSLAAATALAPYLGYDKTAELVKQAIKEDISLKEVIQKNKILSEKQFNQLMSIKQISKPAKKIKL